MSAREQLDLVGLLSKILADTPRMPGAACAQWPGLHDPANDGEPGDDVARRHAVAAAVCADCPVLARCNEWAETEKPFAGVIAGRLPPSQRRGRPAAQKEAVT